MQDNIQSPSYWPIVVLLLLIALWSNFSLIFALVLGFIHLAIDKCSALISGAKNQTITNNGAIGNQTNIAQNMTVNNNHKTVYKATPVAKPNYIMSAEDHRLLENAMQKYGNKSLPVTTTTDKKAINNDNSSEYPTPQHKVVAQDETFMEILERKEKGESNSKIIREMFRVTGGGLFLKYNTALKYYLGED